MKYYWHVVGQSAALKSRYGSRTQMNSSRVSLNHTLHEPSLLQAINSNNDIEMSNLKKKEDKQALIPTFSNKDNKVAPSNPALQVEVNYCP